MTNAPKRKPYSLAGHSPAFRNFSVGCKGALTFIGDQGGMMVPRSLFTILALTTLLCTSTLAATGGAPVSEAMKTSIVNLLFEKGMCSGVVLDQGVILTAAHCRDMLGQPVLASWLGANEGVADCAVSDVIDYAYAPEAEPILPLNVHAPDILLLKLDNPLCGTAPAQLQSRPLEVGERFWQAGHGAGSGDFYTAHQVELELIEPKDPAKLVQPLRSLSRRLLENGADTYQFALPTIPQSSACHNDSGGPSFIEKDGKMLVFGLNGAVLPNEQLGAPKCNNFYLHLLTPVTPYRDWILQKVVHW
jgi:hypothetical protein